jgi:hypothetical protein
MITSPEILDELKGISPLLAGMEKVNVFHVPEGYFNDLHSRIANYAMLNDNIETEITETNLPKVPAGYFDTLSDQILSKIKTIYFESAEEELRKLSPMLYALKGENIFAVPKGYFESFTGEVLEKIKPAPAKIVSMKSSRSWWKYAAAAVVTGAIAITSLQIFNGSHDKDILASVSPDIKASFQYKNEEQLDAGIAKLSDDEIIKYLENNGNVMDNELLTNNTDVSEMPSQSDYLSDENTLNTYLDKIDAEAADKLTP